MSDTPDAADTPSDMPSGTPSGTPSDTSSETQPTIDLSKLDATEVARGVTAYRTPSGPSDDPVIEDVTDATEGSTETAKAAHAQRDGADVPAKARRKRVRRKMADVGRSWETLPDDWADQVKGVDVAVDKEELRRRLRERIKSKQGSRGPRTAIKPPKSIPEATAIEVDNLKSKRPTASSPVPWRVMLHWGEIRAQAIIANMMRAGPVQVQSDPRTLAVSLLEAGKQQSWSLEKLVQTFLETEFKNM
jgi:hypothetical protein